MQLTAPEGVALALMALCLLLVPLGIPGLWGMMLVLLALAAMGEFPWLLWGALLAVAAAAELLEFLIVKRFGRRYGGSTRAFWGAVAGGLVGLFVGAPIPVVGSLLTGLVGTFAGAAVVTMAETRSAGRASKVGWGVLLARVVSVGVKVGAGVTLLLAAGARVLFG